jgi:hypothetical protein
MNRSKCDQIALGVTVVISLIIAGVAVSQLQKMALRFSAGPNMM